MGTGLTFALPWNFQLNIDLIANLTEKRTLYVTHHKNQNFEIKSDKVLLEINQRSGSMYINNDVDLILIDSFTFWILLSVIVLLDRPDCH